MPVAASLTSSWIVWSKPSTIWRISPSGTVKGQSSRFDPEDSDRSYVTEHPENVDEPSVAPVWSLNATDVKTIFAFCGLSRYATPALSDTGASAAPSRSAWSDAEAGRVPPSTKLIVPDTLRLV